MYSWPLYMPWSVATPITCMPQNSQQPCPSYWCAGSIYNPPCMVCNSSLICLFKRLRWLFETVMLHSGVSLFFGNLPITVRMQWSTGAPTIPVYSWKTTSCCLFDMCKKYTTVVADSHEKGRVFNVAFSVMLSPQVEGRTELASKVSKHDESCNWQLPF